MNTQSSQPLRQRRPPQITLGFMMLMMVVFAVISAGLFYASRVPVVREEISVLVRGKAAPSGAAVGRTAQITFILFTFSSPLLLAAFLASCLGLWRWFERRREAGALRHEAGALRHEAGALRHEAGAPRQEALPGDQQGSPHPVHF